MLLGELEFDGAVFPLGKRQLGMRPAGHRFTRCRAPNHSAEAEIPDRLEVRKQRQPEEAAAAIGLQGHGVVQQDPLRVPGEDRKHPHPEQVVADLFKDCRVALSGDDTSIDVRGPPALDQLALDQLVRLNVHGETADRRPAGQVEDERALLLDVVWVVERLVDLDQGHRRLQHDVDVVSGDVQPLGGTGLRVADEQLPQALRGLLRGGPGLDSLSPGGRQRLDGEILGPGLADQGVVGSDLLRLFLA